MDNESNPDDAAESKAEQDENLGNSDSLCSNKDIPFVPRGKSADSIEILAAAKKDDVVMIKKILAASKELDLDTADEVGKTVLHYLSNNARIDEIMLCLNRKCDVDKADKLGWTPLHYAALKGHAAVAQILLNFGANCDAADKQQGKTPLHYAVSRDNRGMVDLLLESGADPSIKDNQDKMPSDVCKNELMKSTIETAIQKMEERTIGAVSETLNVSMDKPTAFSQLGLTLGPKTKSEAPESSASEDTYFRMSMRRTSPATSKIDFGIAESEDICSEVFTHKMVGMMPESLSMEINIPVTTGPEKNEEMVLKTDTGQEIPANGVKEEDEMWFCSATADMMTFHSFIVVCRTKTERFQVGRQACKIQSALDDRVEMEIPKGTFDSNVTLTMEIMDPPQQDQLDNVMKECSELKSTSSFYTLESGGSKLLKPVSVKVPLPSNYQGSNNLLILSMDDSVENEKPESWKIISRGPKLKNKRVEFEVSSFSIKCAVETASTISDDPSEFERSVSVLSQVSRVFRKARRKEYQVLFVCLTRRLGTTNTFKVVVECCKENHLSARLAYWEAEGFERQGADSNAPPITVRAKERFDIVLKSMKLLKKKGKLGIEFHPKIDNQESFDVKLEEDQKVSTGTVEIWKADQQADTNLDQSTESFKSKVFTLNLKFVKFDPRLMNQDRSFLSYQRLLTLLKTVGDQWWKILILVGVSFHAMDKTLQSSSGSIEDKVNAMLFDWREQHREDRSRGLPLLLAALCRSNHRGYATDLQIQLRQWKNDPENKMDSFKEWLLMAYRFDLLIPTVYEKPMSDGFLAMLADKIEPSMKFAAALNLPEGIVKDILTKTHVYPVPGLRTMKLLDMYRVGISDKQGALVGLAHALTTAGLNQQRRYLIMATTAWLRKAGSGDPMARDVEQFLQEVAVDNNAQI